MTRTTQNRLPDLTRFQLLVKESESEDRAQMMGSPNGLLTLVVCLGVYGIVGGRMIEYIDVDPIVALILAAAVPMSLALGAIIARHELRKRGVLS